MNMWIFVILIMVIIIVSQNNDDDNHGKLIPVDKNKLFLR